ncbi:hypothetical protein N9W89_08110 [Hellea sp.]|nr:hypothetical protein [Hellea sp.]
MTKKAKLHMSMLRAAYLNGNQLALFEALNILMGHRPYRIDEQLETKVADVPVWILQALREMVVFRIENEKRNKVGAKPQDRMKLLASKAKGIAKDELAKGKNKLGLYELAQQILIEKMGEGLQPETIKKYASEFEREDKKHENLGKYLVLSEEDDAIYNAVKEGIN